MLKASENKNVFNCRLKAAWDDVLQIDSGRRLHAAGPAYRRNLALRTWYAAAAERSRSIQPNVDLRVFTPSWWIERRQRYNVTV